MRLLLAICGLVWALVLGLLSLPFIFLSLGYDAIGDQESGDRWMDRASISMWMNFLENRS